jgi:hypothetical protein
MVVWFEEAADKDGCVPADFLFWDAMADFMTENLHLRMAQRLWGVLPMPDFMNPAPGLPHDDFRRAHDHFRGAHFNHRRADDDCVMTFISRVFAPPTIRNKASGSGKEAGNGD